MKCKIVVMLLKPLMKLTFAQWLKIRREMAKISQTQIAEALNVRRSTVSNWETGFSVPSLNPRQTLELCTILKVSLEELVQGFEGDVELSLSSK